LSSARLSYINHENVIRYQKLIAISEVDPCRGRSTPPNAVAATNRRGQGGPGPRESRRPQTLTMTAKREELVRQQDIYRPNGLTKRVLGGNSKIV